MLVASAFKIQKTKMVGWGERNASFRIALITFKKSFAETNSLKSEVNVAVLNFQNL